MPAQLPSRRARPFSKKRAARRRRSSFGEQFFVDHDERDEGRDGHEHPEDRGAALRERQPDQATAAGGDGDFGMS